MINIFGTSGIRGILGETHDITDVIHIATSINDYFNGGPVLIGYDCRRHSIPLAYMIASLLSVYGEDVSIAGVISTPSLQSYLKVNNGLYNYGIMLTASHNPKQYFGIKVFDSNGIEVSKDKEIKISEIYHEYWSERRERKIDWSISKSRFLDVSEDIMINYIDKMDTLFQEFSDYVHQLKMAADYCNCGAINTAGRYLSQKFSNIIHINNKIVDAFPSREPEPTPDNIKHIVERLIGKIDIGVSFDGDADRGMIFDGRGRIYWGDEIGVLVSLILKDELNIKEVVTPISSNSRLIETLKDEGIDIIWTKVGAKNVVDEMIAKNIPLGFEENGGLIYLPHIAGRDGLLTFLLTLRILEKEKKKLYELRSKLPKTVTIKSSIYVKGDKNEIFRKLEEKIISEYGDDIANVLRIDGVKIFLRDGRATLIRPSGTEPKIRIFSEAETQTDAEKMNKQIHRLINDIMETV